MYHLVTRFINDRRLHHFLSDFGREIFTTIAVKIVRVRILDVFKSQMIHSASLHRLNSYIVFDVFMVLFSHLSFRLLTNHGSFEKNF